MQPPQKGGLVLETTETTVLIPHAADLRSKDFFASPGYRAHIRFFVCGFLLISFSVHFAIIKDPSNSKRMTVLIREQTDGECGYLDVHRRKQSRAAHR
jgi:hypothetical protein